MLKAFVEMTASDRRDQPAGRHRRRRVIALDAKMNSTTNALYRHKDVERCATQDEEGPAELRSRQAQPQLHQARRQHRLHGNGAGLAMATMDIIKLYGGSRPTSSTSAAAPPRSA
jgi:succinyl-CoA synthetase beta subunit